MAKTIAICNQKGSVNKTTTTLNLGIGLAREGKRVLLVYAEPCLVAYNEVGDYKDASERIAVCTSNITTIQEMLEL